MDKEILKQIQKSIAKDDYRYSEHTINRILARRIADWEIKQAIENGEIIENYSHNKYRPSCLIFGETDEGRPLHIQCSYPPNVKIITCYEPSPEEWINYEIRRYNEGIVHLEVMNASK